MSSTAPVVRIGAPRRLSVIDADLQLQRRMSITITLTFRTFVHPK